MDLCLSCKACTAECPSNVNLAKLKAEFQHAYYADRPRPLGHHLLRHVRGLSAVAARFAGPLNWVGRRPFLRGLMESVTGVDRRRSLPHLHRDHFRRWFSQRRTAAGGRRTGFVPPSAFPLPPSPRRVILLDDCFTTYQEPHIGRAAVELLERLGYAVELAGLCCGRAHISKGFLADARRLARDGIARLHRAAADGVPILGLEPSCLLTLADEWPELVPGPAAKAVAGAAELAEAWVGRAIGDTRMSLAPQPGAAVFHPHCHQRALVGPAGTADALRRVPGLAVTTLDAGCCGMAGAFGYEKEHYDLSVRIAELGVLPAVQAHPDALLVATGTSCRHQLRDLTGRHPVHPVEVLAAALPPVPAL
jgi:Fe-S oxidoreductase